MLTKKVWKRNAIAHRALLLIMTMTMSTTTLPLSSAKTKRHRESQRQRLQRGFLPFSKKKKKKKKKKSKDFHRGSRNKKASSSSPLSTSSILEEELHRARREISELTRANETMENENAELLIFLENFRKEMENERKKVSQAKEEIDQLTSALESSKESIQILSSDREQLSDQLEQASKKLRVANRHVSISKEKEATLASRNEEVRKLANRIDSLLTDGYVAVAHDTTNNITKKKKKGHWKFQHEKWHHRCQFYHFSAQQKR